MDSNYYLSKIKELKEINKLAEKDIKIAPKGRLRIIHCKGTTQYYWNNQFEEKSNKYIKKSDKKLAYQLAQKSYAIKVISLTKEMIKQLEASMDVEVRGKITKLYDTLSDDRKQLVTPYALSDDAFAKIWENQKHDAKRKFGKNDLASLPEEDVIFTERGERVRSKSEKIIADKLYMMGIPYVYEIPLKLAGYGVVMTDFIALNKRTRDEFYMEHLGMMDHQLYCEKAIKKIETYEKNGFFPGKRLLLTYETNNHPLNIKILDCLICEYLL